MFIKSVIIIIMFHNWIQTDTYVYAYSSREKVSEQRQKAETAIFCVQLCIKHDLSVRINLKHTFEIGSEIQTIISSLKGF